MPRQTASLPGLTLTPHSDRPLARQLASALRESMLSGQLGPGARLPSTRLLAGELGVSRNTVLEAYAELLAEGYLEGQIGSGTFVSRLLPEEGRAVGHADTAEDLSTIALSARGERIAGVRHWQSGVELRPFNPGLPALDPALFDFWWRTAARWRRRLGPAELNYGDAAGYGPLREAIAAWVGPSRGVRCTARQIIVTAGAQPALALAARLLLDVGDQAWMEDPGYEGAKGALIAAGLTLVPVPVDDDGLDVDEGMARAPEARMAYVSPSHQYPLGVVMALTRRLRLLEWAERAGAWIVEDDYDTEFRYGGRPLPALQSLDRASRVLYVGTFSKVLFPSLRLGYIVVPDELVGAFRRAQATAGHRPSTLDQAVLAEILASGQFMRHVRRMRRRYEQRRDLLDAEIRRQLAPSLMLTGAHTGLHGVGRLAPGFDDRDVSARAAAAGISVPPLSAYYTGPPRVSGLVLGYGHLDENAIRAGVRALASLLRAG
ncbi:MAG: PLP-dependent aminotransferase family protein [Acidobacteriota bacterium]|nr:PLP-dependent aminotransferase family protein [Acidobacteriota bacterium]